MINSKPNIFNCYIDNLKTTGFTTLVHFWLYVIGGSDEFESRTQIYENLEIPNKQTNRHLSNFIAECDLCFGWPIEQLRRTKLLAPHVRKI
jgi:hypothetical protein